MRVLSRILLVFLSLLTLGVSVANAAMGGAGAVQSHTLWYYIGVGAVGVAALGVGNLTLAEIVKRMDPDGKAAALVELLNQSNDILTDMNWMEGNLPTGHRTSVRVGLPTVAWRLLNAGITPSKSITAQIDEGCGILEAWSEVDIDVYKLNGETAAFRLSEARAFIEAMNQELARVLFYGNAGLNQEQFNGLSVRYSLSTAPNGSNVIKCGGSGSDNASIWLVSWGDDTCTGIFPKGSIAGLQHNDYGEVTAEVTAGLPGSRMRVMQERFQWKAGIALRDWRYVVRLCNIDISDTDAANIKTIITNMETAIETIPNMLGRRVFYMNRTMRRLLRREARESVGSGGGLTYENFDGKRILVFGDVPVRLSDQLTNAETLVS
jgi:hypothetical protein